MARLGRRLARVDPGCLRLQLLMVRISKDFGVPLTQVAIVFTLTFVDAACRRHRLPLARRPDRPQEAVDDLDRLVLGLQTPRRSRAELLVAIAVRTALGIGMGAEWPAGAALAMEPWPQRSRGSSRSIEWVLSLPICGDGQ
jgi:MFS transporter, SHS family, lactate transporter